jgi:hypothetical protein
MNFAGVTSNAGLNVLVPRGAMAMLAQVRDLAVVAFLDGNQGARAQRKVHRR